MISPKLILILVIAFFSTSINSINIDEEPEIQTIINVESDCIAGDCFFNRMY